MISQCVMKSASFLISHLTSLDFFVSYWKRGLVGHTFVSFNFEVDFKSMVNRNRLLRRWRSTISTSWLSEFLESLSCRNARCR
jgi:hypothetical protein